MDWEAPVDAWYVWLAVALVSFAIAGIALAVPTGPPPDANAAANAIDRVSGANYQASATHSHDADEVKITPKTIALKNEHGTDHASFAYGQVVPVGDDEQLQAVAHGVPYGDVYADSSSWIRHYLSPTTEEEALAEAISSSLSEAEGTWNVSNGELTVRKVRFGRGIRGTNSLFASYATPADVEEQYEWIQFDADQEEFYVTLVHA